LKTTAAKVAPFTIQCPKCAHKGDLVEFATAGGGGGCETCGHGAIYYVSLHCPKCGAYDSTEL